MKTVLRILVPLLFLAGGVALTGVLIGLKPEVVPQEAEIPAPLVETILAVSEELQLEVHTQGVVTPRTESRLTAEVGARIIEVSPHFVDGGFFEAGEVLVRLDPTDYRLALDQARVTVAQAEARLAQEEADAAINLREWRSERGDEPPPPLAVRGPQVAEAKASLASAESQLAKARRDVERCTITAPYDGRVRMAEADLGEFVMTGGQLGLVYAVDWAEVRLPLPDAELAFLDLPLSYRGEEVTATGPEVRLEAAFAGKRHTWNGRVVRTEGEIDAQSRMVMAVARVEDPYARGDAERPPLAVGLFVRAALAGHVIPNALALPREALRTGERVFLLTDDERLEIRTVEVLRRERERVLVGAGLAAGERVIVSPLEAAVDGMRLRTLEPTDRAFAGGGAGSSLAVDGPLESAGGER